MLDSIILINKIQLAVERKNNFIFLSEHLSKNSLSLLNLLQKNGWICFYKYIQVKGCNKIQVKFRFNHQRNNVIHSIKLVGNNANNIFTSINNLWKKNKGQSTLVIQTSQGLLTDTEARQLNLGGKLFLVIN